MALNDLLDNKNQKGFFTLSEAGVIMSLLSATAFFVAVAYGGCQGIKALRKYNTDTPQVVTKDVIAGPGLEAYIEKDGIRFYSKINDKPVESCFFK